MRRPSIELPELVELVIDNLASDKRSLATCAQLSRLWVIASPLCTIRLNIHTLIISDENECTYEWPIQHVFPPETWIALPPLAHLQSLTMRHLQVEMSPTDGFHGLGQIKTLKRLTIDSTRFSTKSLFFTFLSSLPFLTHLSLQHVLSSPSPSAPDEHARLPPTLRQFSASFDSHTVRLIDGLCGQTKEEGIPTITDMTFTEWSYANTPPRLFSMFSASLEHFRVELSPGTNVQAVYAFRTSSPILTTLSFYNLDGRALQTLGFCLTWGDLPALTSLTFHFILSGFVYSDSWDLSHLEFVLNLLPKLAQVTFRFELKDDLKVSLRLGGTYTNTGYGRNMLREYLEGRIRRGFATLKGVLQVEFV